MEKAKMYALLGNLLQTIWFAILVLISFLNAGLALLNIIPAHNFGMLQNALSLIVLAILSWIAAVRLESKGWRILLLLIAIVTMLYNFNLIAGALFIAAYIAADKASKAI